MDASSRLQSLYPWITQPAIVSAPMRLIAFAPLAVAVSGGGGIGFVAAGSDTSTLEANLAEVANEMARNPTPLGSGMSVLPIGVGFLNWGANLDEAVAAFANHRPAAAWFFAPRKTEDLSTWADALRGATGGRTTIWVQVGTVAEAVGAVAACKPDVLVVQGTDAGGHGRQRGASIVALLPEVDDAIAGLGLSPEQTPVLMAAGGIVDGRGVAAAMVLGAHGVVMGTRFLACPEAVISQGYRQAVIDASDGGISTARTSLYDQLRGTTDWPAGFNARGVLNRSWDDAEQGMGLEENKRLYGEAVALGDGGWGPQGRMATYAGTAVGLMSRVMPAREIVEETRREAEDRLRRFVR